MSEFRAVGEAFCWMVMVEAKKGERTEQILGAEQLVDHFLWVSHGYSVLCPEFQSRASCERDSEEIEDHV